MTSTGLLAVPANGKNAPKTLALGAVIALCVVAAPMLIGWAGGNYWVRVLDGAALYVMLALGLNVVVGFAGLLDMGYIAFYAVGAYTAALLTSPQLTTNFAWIAAALPGGMHTPYLIVIPVAMVLAAGAGILLGVPTLRLRGDYLAIVTLGFGEIVRIFMNNLDRPLNITNGPQGITGVAPLSFGGFDFSTPHTLFGFTFTDIYLYYYMFVLCALLAIWVCTRLQHSRIGRAWAALREDETAARAMGINTRNVKLLAFAMGASFGGLSGAMFGAFQGFVSPDSFTYFESIVVLSCVVLGGMGHIPGVILGAVLLAVFPEVLRVTMVPLQNFLFALQNSLFGHEIVDVSKLLGDVSAIRQLMYGGAMVVVMLFRPEGIWPAPRHEDKMAKLARKNAGKPART